MNWANQRYVIGRGLAAIRHISDTNLNWFIKAIIDNSLQEILSAATGSTFPLTSEKTYLITFRLSFLIHRL